MSTRAIRRTDSWTLTTDPDPTVPRAPAVVPSPQLAEEILARSWSSARQQSSMPGGRCHGFQHTASMSDKECIGSEDKPAPLIDTAKTLELDVVDFLLQQWAN